MFYKLKNDAFIRFFDGCGYIVSVGLFNDRVVDSAGSAFLSALSRKPRSLNDLSEMIASKFVGVTASQISSDVEEFFNILVEDGFLSAGYSYEDAVNADSGFSYSRAKPGLQKEDFTPSVIRSEKDTQSVLQDIFRKSPRLHSFQIELTSRCNERCVHCYIPHKNKSGDIQPKLYYSVLDQLEKMGTLTVTLSGGEPLSHPDFLDFLRAAKAKDFYVVVLTNLTLLSDEIISVLKEGCVSSVQTSLYSMIPEHHDAITTVTGSFKKTHDAILQLIENDIPVQISCPTMKGNHNDFVDVLKWANAHRIRAFTDPSIMAMYDHDTSNLANRLTPDECCEVFIDILEYDTPYQKRILSSDFPTEMEKARFKPNDQFCGVGVSTCCMVANGNVYPCAGWQECVCGNLYEKSLEDIWLYSKKLEWLRNLKKKDMPRCLSCENQAFCSPCLVRFANESPTGNPLEICDHFCKVAAINRDVVIKWREQRLIQTVADKIMTRIKELDLKAGYYWPEQNQLSFRASMPKEEGTLFPEALALLIKRGYLEEKPEIDNQIFVTENGEEYSLNL